MIPDEPFESTCRARGFKEDEITQKILHGRGNLLSKIRAANSCLAEDIDSTPILWDGVKKMPEYMEQFEIIKKLYETNQKFKKDARCIVCKTLKEI